MRNEFVHLHLHSHYSLLDAMNRFDHLAEAVKSRGMRAVALTDHGNLFGAIEFYKTIYAHGVKPIIGCEVYVAPGSRHDKEKRPDRFERGFHLTLLASSADGYRNLVKLSSLGFTEGFYYNARVDYETLDTYSEGLIALSGCLSSEAAKKYLSGNETGAREAIDRNREIFGKENFFIELMDHGIAEQKQYMQFLLETAHRDEIPTIATNDVHYLDQKDCHFHDALLCVGTRSHISDTKRKKYGAQEFFLKTPDEMAKVFGFDLGTLKRTVEIAERVELDIEFGKNHLPSFPIPIGEGNEIEYLEKLALEGLISKVDNPNDDYRDRLKYELKIIGKKGFPGYFLIVADFISEAKRRGIPVGPGRGSAAGSLVSFTLGITDVDPMKYGLIFERFLNPERTELPDIDVDICQTRREEVIDYVKERYGHDRVAQIITFGTFGPRAVLRDVARVQEISIQETEKLIKLIPDQLKITLPEAIDKVDELKKASEGPYKDLFDTALGLEGLARHASRHAAGVVIANLPITEVAPLYRDSEGHIITQFDMNSVVALGLLKMDILGLKTLSVVARAEKLAGRMSASGDSPYEFCADIGDMDDPKVFDLLSSGRTLGVFQLDSSGIRDLIMKVKPSCFEDLAAMIALYRPGPISLADDFAARKHGKQDVVYLHPSIEKILNTTYGIILYQEQVMEIAHVVGNFKLSEADSLRKAMGKKNPELMGSYREKFVKGAVQNEVKTEISKKLFDQMEQFAGYGFNKSHAIAYAVIAYKTAWLKVHEPIAYMAAVLSFESGNTDKLAIYIEEARRMGIEVMPPDVNTSHVYFEGSPEKKNAIMYGLAAVKGVGVGASEEIIEIRSNSKYQSFWDLLTRTDRKKLGKRAIEALCMVGGMDGLGSNRRSMSDVLPSFWDLALSQAKEADSDQISLFGKEDIRDPVIPDLEEFDDFSGYEFDYLGLYLTDHPLLKRFPAAKILKKQTSHSQNSSEKTWVVGILASVVPVLDKRDQQMARGRIETLDSRINLIVFASTYKRQKVNLQEGTVVLLLGKLEGADRMIVDSVHPVEDVKWMARVKLGDSTDDKFLEKIEKVLDKTKSGNCSIEIEMKREGKRFRLKSPHKVDPGDLSEGLSGIDHVEAELRPLDSK